MDANGLRQLPLFEHLSKKQVERVAAWADEIDLPAGKHLIDQGTFPHEFFVLIEGSAEVLQDGRHIADLGPGDFFGEIALVEHQRRTASVITTTPARVVVMFAREFGVMENELPEVCERIRQAMLERQRRLRDEGKEPSAQLPARIGCTHEGRSGAVPLSSMARQASSVRRSPGDTGNS
jgi:CRP-like cAMP-binding protein